MLHGKVYKYRFKFFSAIQPTDYYGKTPGLIIELPKIIAGKRGKNISKLAAPVRISSVI